MKDYDKFTPEEEAEYIERVKKNYKFIRRFVKDCITVDLERETDYYGNTEWYNSDTRVETPCFLEENNEE